MNAVARPGEKVAAQYMVPCAGLLLDIPSSPCYPPAVVPSVVSAHAAFLPPVLREDMSALPVVEGTFLKEVQPVSVRLERNVSPVGFDKAHWNYITLYLKYGQCHALHTWFTLAMGEGWRKKALKKLHLKTMHTSTDYATAQGWIRDLHEEGIEPHPGPPTSKRIICKNLDGKVSKNAEFERFMNAIMREHKLDPLAAVCVQEHNLPKTQMNYYHRRAGQRKILFLAKHAPPRDPDHPDRARKGTGTAVAIPYEAIERLTLANGKTEDLHTAIKRVQRTLQGDKDGRVTSVTTLIHGRKFKITSAYAPASPHAAERIDFFKNILPKYVTNNTILCTDANCVPDTSLDLLRDATS